MKAEAMSIKAIKVTSHMVNLAVLTMMLLLMTYAGYALWDSKQIHQQADKTLYEKYKPTAHDEGKSFQELQALNPEVIAWVEVYGTNIDYPVTQGSNNMKYVNTDAEGRYSLSGSIFLDCNNKKDFSDFNSILFGHHMSQKAMFGEIGEFSDRDMFESHLYGNLFFEGKDHGIAFFAFLHEDAYDLSVFLPGIDREGRQAYLDNLRSSAIHTRDINVTTDDRIVLLATCSSSSTNGRDILVGKITDEVYENSFLNEKTNGVSSLNGFSKEVYPVHLLLAVLTIMLVIGIYLRTTNKSKNSDAEGTGQ
jgi:sortase B